MASAVQAFDEVILLKRGGEVIYNGSLGQQSCALVDYFESIPGVARIAPDYNPATWMLEISTVSAEMRLHMDLARVYEQSHLARYADRPLQCTDCRNIDISQAVCQHRGVELTGFAA